MDIFMASFFPQLIVSVYQTERGMVTLHILQQHLRPGISSPPKKIEPLSKFVLI